ncbi:unnamed protein product [Clonostachys byssicola]|uniref:Nephrocystin 3-like N-terminal domain-containing protein n=1 Tax=Clonostachys byssicola TaxID=160290 RepID=A0A9N9Y969_9HYPO|nr:unnamed protein product [Clonostachys byssicola]
MSDSTWLPRVYRLRRLPHHVGSEAEAEDLFSKAFDVPSDNIRVHSLATTHNRLEVPPSKVCTLRLRSLPACVRRDGSDNEWEAPHPEQPGCKLVLDTHFEGITVLNDIKPDSHHTDCICISGLASHPFGSWQTHGHDKSFMWLRDEIPRLIPGVRVILYGYNSQILKSKSFQSITDIALGLINQLQAGGWTMKSSKSLIFLAHSLGGIVLKDAIVQIADREIVASILDKIKGIIMFGVPNLGIYNSHLIMMTQGQPNESLIQELSRGNGNSYLRELNRRFDGLSFITRAKIYWAYETKESATVLRQLDGQWGRNGPSEILVSPDSATCYFNSKNKIMTIPIDKDHSSMVKFSRGDKDLEIILQTIGELCYIKQPENLDKSVAGSNFMGHRPLENSQGSSDGSHFQGQEFLMDQADMCKNLNANELDFRLSQIEDPFQETFGWVFKLPLFRDWLQQGCDIFWINGKPGSGKSTLMKHIFKSKVTWELLHDWRRSTNEVKEMIAGFFFNYRGTPLQKSFEGILRSLILQIINPHVRKFAKEHSEISALLARRKRILSFLEQFEELLRIIAPTALATDGDNQSSQNERDQILPNIESAEKQLSDIDGELSLIFQKLQYYKDSPDFRLLSLIQTEYRQPGDGLIHKLEKMLRLLLDQNIIQMDLFLFFDALDEFDGHLDMICRFLKSLILNPSNNGTRVKVCFSSRPWKALQEHFYEYPGFSLQEHTQDDIESYAASRLAISCTTSSITQDLIPTIIAKASGVFLWVRLAISEILATVSAHPKGISKEKLRDVLQHLPDDLQEFYKLTVDRIAKSDRRRAFALLELIIRAREPRHVDDIWRAVQIAGCSTFQEASPFVKYTFGVWHCYPRDQNPHIEQVSDVITWGGGLVEVVRGYPQLMHQTVLEFTLSLSFKKYVLGDLSSLVTENGHSFYMKFLLSSMAWDNMLRETPQTEDQDELAFHAKQSELTTGKSHLQFFQSIPEAELVKLSEVDISPYSRVAASLVFFSSLGLVLCIRDWMEGNPSKLQHVCKKEASLPIMTSLIIKRIESGELQRRYLETFKSLLDHGFDMKRDPDFLETLVTRCLAIVRTSDNEVSFSRDGLDSDSTVISVEYRRRKIVQNFTAQLASEDEQTFHDLDAANKVCEVVYEIFDILAKAGVDFLLISETLMQKLIKELERRGHVTDILREWPRGKTRTLGRTYIRRLKRLFK